MESTYNLHLVIHCDSKCFITWKLFFVVVIVFKRILLLNRRRENIFSIFVKISLKVYLRILIVEFKLQFESEF